MQGIKFAEPQGNRMTTRHVNYLILFIVSILFTSLNVSEALISGALSSPPIYDDNGYLLDGYNRIAFDNVHSIWSLVVNFIQYPPHAPIETVSIILGYWLFGPFNVGPYIANFWAIFAYSLMIYYISEKETSSFVALLIATIAMFIPVAGTLVSESRPDMTAGLFFGFCGYLLITTETWNRNAYSAAMLGLLCAFSVLVKLSAVVITIPMLALALAIGIFHHKNHWRSAIRPTVIMFLAAMIFLAPAGFIWGNQTYSYIYQALFSNKDIWQTPGDWYFHLTFSAIGENGGSLALGNLLYVGLFFIILSAFYNFRIKRYQLVYYYLWTLLIYVGISFSAEKTVYQSSFFFFPFIISSICSISALMPKSENVARRSAVILLCMAVLFLEPSHTFQKGIYRKDTVDMLSQLTSAVERGTWNISSCSGSTDYVYSTVGSYPITAEAVALDVAQKHHLRLKISHLFMLRSLDEVMAKVENSNFVLTPNAKGLAESLQQRLPGAKFNEDVKTRLRADTRWREVSIDAADPLILFLRQKC